MPSRPLIGIAPTILKQKKTADWIGTYQSYIQSIEDAGGEPVILTPNAQNAKRYLKMLDGLLLTGGADIHPKYFGQKFPKGAKIDVSPDERTKFELHMIRNFLKARKPILGICLGCQSLNIAAGGDLIQDLPSQHQLVHDHKNGDHFVRLKRGSLFQRLLGKKLVKVNSRHHQSVKKLGKGLRICALSSDGVVEAIEAKSHPFAVGVQWHPEIMPKHKEARKLFQAFVNACKGKG